MNEVKNNPYVDLGQLAQDNSQLPGNIQGENYVNCYANCPLG